MEGVNPSNFRAWRAPKAGRMARNVGPKHTSACRTAPERDVMRRSLLHACTHACICIVLKNTIIKTTGIMRYCRDNVLCVVSPSDTMSTGNRMAEVVAAPAATERRICSASVAERAGSVKHRICRVRLRRRCVKIAGASAAPHTHEHVHRTCSEAVCCVL